MGSAESATQVESAALPVSPEGPAGGAARVGGSRRLRAILVAVLAAEIVAFACLLPRDERLWYGLGRLLHLQAEALPPPDYSAVLRNDPPLGLSLPEGGAGAHVRRAAAPSRVGYLVCFVGDCAGCMHADLQPWERKAAQGGMGMVLITTAAASAAARFRRDAGLRVPIVSDPGGALVQQLNAAWPGRAYLFSPTWRLLWLDRRVDPTDDPFEKQGFKAALGQTPARAGGRE